MIAFLLVACGPVEVDDVNAAVFHRSCSVDTCHGAADGSGGLMLGPDVDTREQLVNVPSEGVPSELRVVPGDPESSYILWKLQGLAGIDGDPMPPFEGAQLPDEDLDLIREWILDGAL